MNILHFSDLHGKLPQIPKKYHGTDIVIVLSGDICDNFPNHWIPCIKQWPNITPSTWNGFWNFRQIDGVEEGRLQDEWVETKLVPHLKNCHISFDNVIVVNGNHDWCHFDKWFPNSLHTGSRTILFRSVKIGLLVGVPNFTGEWFEEIGPVEMDKRIKALDPDIEILVSHTPPYSILDRGHGESNIGSQELYVALFGRSVFDVQEPYFNKLKLNLFGHAHDARGAKHFEFGERKLKCYNASQTRFEIEYSLDINPSPVVE